MEKHTRILSGLLILILGMLACASPLGEGGDEPSSPDQVATIVAGTLQALTSVVPDAPTGTPVPTGILPHSIYFLGRDGATGLMQVFRIERDGVTQRQITAEPVKVDTYDVSLMDGRVAYTSNNQLLLINADGSGRRLLVEGGPVDVNNPILNSLTNPVFSPNAQTIAYGQGGLNLYNLSTGASNRVLETIGTDPFSGLPAPSVLYFPEKYSPDGTKILVTTAIPNSDGISAGIYFPAADSFVQISGAENSATCCGEPNWSLDSSALLAASPSVGIFGSGLWRVDAVTGAAVTLLPSEAGGGNFNLAEEPYLAPDGQLYFFFATASAPEGFIDNAPLQIVRSAPDGVSGRMILRPDTYALLNEALWSPDAGFVVIAIAPDASTYAGGRAEVTYLDGRPSVVLTPFALNMKWGP